MDGSNPLDMKLGTGKLADDGAASGFADATATGVALAGMGRFMAGSGVFPADGEGIAIFTGLDSARLYCVGTMFPWRPLDAKRSTGGPIIVK